MKKVFISIALLVVAITAGNAQNTDQAHPKNILDVLSLIRENNKDIQAERALTTAKSLEDKSENNLPDPTVSYSHLWGNQEGMGFTGEFIAEQSFSFPTIYAKRKQLNKERLSQYKYQEDIIRQNVLLQAKNICFDLIYLNRLKEILSERLNNAEQLSKFYRSRLESGSVNRIDMNKIDLELLNAKNEYRVNETSIAAKLQELAALNGGEFIHFEAKEYDSEPIIPNNFEDMKEELISGSAELNFLKTEEAAAMREITLNKNLWFPELRVGYRMNPSSGGQRYNGIIAGVSIPLFANRNKVKQAKANAIYATSKYESGINSTESALRQLWNRAVSLQSSVSEYRTMLDSQDNIKLLNQSIQAGQISIIEYFANVTTIYQSFSNYYQLENEYQKTVAELYKYQL